MEINNINLLPAEMIGEFFSYFQDVPLKEFLILSLVCKLWKDNLIDSKVYQTQKEWFIAEKTIPKLKYIPRSLVEAFGGPKTVSSLPELKLSNQTKSQEYIDFITPDMMKDSIMRGVDLYNRFFFCIKLIFDHDESPQPFVLTYFNRYTNNSNKLVYGVKKKNFNYVLVGPYGVTPDNIANIKKLVTEKKIETFISEIEENYSCRIYYPPVHS